MSSDQCPDCDTPYVDDLPDCYCNCQCESCVIHYDEDEDDEDEDDDEDETVYNCGADDCTICNRSEE